MNTPRYSPEYIAAHLDYTVLNPLATIEEIEDGAAYCNKHKIKTYCVASANVEIAVSIHNNVCATVGFPHGNSSPFAKLQEGIVALAQGARELDVVINYGRFLSGDEAIIGQDLQILCAIKRATIKATLESCHYTPAQLARACRRCVVAGVDFVKTSTGFGPEPATPENVQIMLGATRDTDVQVIASRGIKTYNQASGYLDMGCERLGASCYKSICFGT